MPGYDDLSTAELHDRAIGRAERHLDVKFLWELIEQIPAAEAAAGNVPQADADVVSITAWLGEFGKLRSGPVADALRPVFISYLEEHEPKQ